MLRKGNHWSAIGALTLAALVLALGGCDSSATAPLLFDRDASETAVPEVDLEAAVRVPVIAFADLQPTGGNSKLVRTSNGVNYQLQTKGLTPGHAYTLWIVIFNDPYDCTAGTPGVSLCGGADVVNDDARPDMMYAAGHVVGGSGTTTFAGRRTVDDAGGSANGPVGLPAYGLENPGGAEFHLVVHDHGPANSDYMPDMIQSIDGGCTDVGIPAAGAPSPWNAYAGPPAGAFGRRGPNTCASVQFAIHTP